MASLQTSQPFKLSWLPAELRKIIWEMALVGSGRIILPILECTPASETNNADFQYDTVESCNTNYIIRTPVPALLHVCRESRAVAQETFVDVGQGGSFDQTRDKLLVLANGCLTYSWCQKHLQNVIDETPHLNHTAMSKWSHVQHIIYYAPELCRRSWRQSPRQFGQDLQMMFRLRAGGQVVKTITVLTDEKVGEETWTALDQGWTEPFGNETTDEAYPEPELIPMDDAAIVKEVRGIILEVGPKIRPSAAPALI